MGLNWLEWLGYIASFVILISLVMNSIIMLRWVNSIGAILFTIYGFLIGAYPVAIMNFGIIIINAYYLIKMYRYKNYFTLLPIEPNSGFFKYLLNFYKEDIKVFFASSEFNIENSEIAVFILRNTVPAGIFIASKYNDNTLNVELDYAIPEYRDFKMGKYLYEEHKDFFLTKGYNQLISLSVNKDHDNYLRKMGFEEKYEFDDTNKYFVKILK